LLERQMALTSCSRAPLLRGLLRLGSTCEVVAY
jgi:hypothetical protein